MGAGAALLDPADVQGGRGEVDLVPAQVRQFARPQTMAVGHKDHRGVPVAPSVALGGLEQPLDLGLRQVFAGAQVGIGTARRPNCSYFGVRCHQLEMRFCHVFCPLRVIDCSNNALNTNSMQVAHRAVNAANHDGKMGPLWFAPTVLARSAGAISKIEV